jgi:hypothetical protein
VNELVLSDDLHLPLDAVTQTFGFIGRKGAGKTYAAGVLVEQLFDHGAPVVVLDPVGNWWGLRMAGDGKGEGLPLPIFGGDHGDLPLHPESGRIVASTLLNWQHCSAVLDVSSFRKNERERFVADFAEEFFHEAKKIRRPVMIVLEEAQKFCPQHSRGSERIVGAIEDIVRLGRNYGIGAALLSQRPQSVNKEVLNQVECLLVGQLAGKHERKAIEDWIVEKDINVSASELPKLRVGEMFVWSPQWLGVFKKIRIAKKRTYDASETPKLGAVRGDKKIKLATALDIESLRKNMEEMIEKAREDDPAALRQKISMLQDKLDESKLRRKEPVFDHVLLEILAKEIEEARSLLLQASAYHKLEEGIFDILGRSLSRLKIAETPFFFGGRVEDDGVFRPIPDQEDFRSKYPSTVLGPYSPRDPLLRDPVIDKLDRELARGPYDVSSSGRIERTRKAKTTNGLKRGMREMLFVLQALGGKPLTRPNLGILSVISPSSGSFSDYLSVLRTREFIVEDHNGCITRTDVPVGDPILDDAISVMTSRRALIERWSKKLKKAGIRRMFEALVAAYPEEITRADLAERSGMSRSGSFSDYLSVLRTNRLIEESGPKKLVRLTRVFDIAMERGRGT